MNELDRLKTEAEARRRYGEPGHATRYSGAASRYLAVVNYRESHALVADHTPRPAVVEEGSAEPETQ
jgi:hypothetical protein